MDGATYILERLPAAGSRYFFTVPGAHLDPLFRASKAAHGIRPIVCSNESSAGYMADGYARAKGTMGVVVVHGSPGAHNVVTAVRTASCENVPLLCLSGDVPTSLTRRLAFHNTAEIGSDDGALFAHMTKYSKRVTCASELPRALEQAIAMATARPYGPVHLILPYDVLSGETGFVALMDEREQPDKAADSDGSTKLFLDVLQGDGRLVLWVGDSLNDRRSARNLRSIAEQFGVPVITTYGAKGVIPEDHDLCFGNFGFGGDDRAQALLESGGVEVILALDVDWSERNTANWAPLLTDRFEIQLFHQSPVRGELDNVRPTKCDTHRLLEHAAEISQGDRPGKGRACKWLASMTSPRDGPSPRQTDGLIEPEAVVRTMRKVLPRDTMLFVDAGLHRVFAGKYWNVFEPGTFFSSTIMAATGWAIGAGVGAKLDEDREVVILTGDGCMRMNGMEIVTAVRYRIPVTVVIMDNGGFGSIKSRMANSEAAQRGDFEFDKVDWAALARSLGAQGYRIETQEELTAVLSCPPTDGAVRVLSVATPLTPNLNRGIGDRSAYA